jgi:formylglycine-generating enzyme required for sulfatase activity
VFSLLAAALLASLPPVAVQGTRFVWISGPAATTIRASLSDGTIVWSNALPGTSYSVQTASSLSGGTNWEDYVQIYASNVVNANLIIALNPPAGMVLIPAGELAMENSIGDSDITDAIPTTVTVSAFYIDTTLVTYSQWKTVYSYATNHGYAFDDTGAGKAANHPVHTVDWYDCVKWCNARSEKEGQVPAYYMDAGLTHVYTNGMIDAVYANWSANGYRLPTEAEWEKAACGGLSGRRFRWGDMIHESQANYYGVSSFTA